MSSGMDPSTEFWSISCWHSSVVNLSLLCFSGILVQVLVIWDIALWARLMFCVGVESRG